MKHKLFLSILFCHLCVYLAAQRVHPLVTGIQVDSIMQGQGGVSKIAYDHLSGHLYYTLANGDIREVYNPGTAYPSDTLRYTSADHGISFLQGLFFRDSTMYICGNQWSSTTGTGKVMKAKLQPDGSRVWATVATTQPYPISSPGGDHGFAGLTIDPAGNNIYVSSGARTLLGEIETNSGAWPGKREIPMTTRLLRFPAGATGIVLPNDSALLDASGYVYAWGIRNTYSMAWDATNHLFGIDNDGERDDPEELNWLRMNHHYGFPWRIGGNANPIAHSPYNVNADPLVNHNSAGYQNGSFADNPGFPAIPMGLTFTEPIRNYGPDADFFRDSVTGAVKNASDEGSFITSFTPHRSPLGLVIDKDSLLDTPYRGDAFLTSFMPGGDSTGYTPLTPWGGPCPFVDPTRDLLHVKLSYNASIDNYTMNVYRIAEGLYLPVDATLVGNELYIIENSGKLWRVTMPGYSGIPQVIKTTGLLVFPNPGSREVAFKFNSVAAPDVHLTIYDIRGRKVFETVDFTPTAAGSEIRVDLSTWSEGIYVYKLIAGGSTTMGKLIKAGN